MVNRINILAIKTAKWNDGSDEQAVSFGPCADDSETINPPEWCKDLKYDRDHFTRFAHFHPLRARHILKIY